MRFKKTVQEKSLIEKIQRLSLRTGATHLDDDAAYCPPLVISTDQFVEETHFRWSQASPQQIAHKGVVQALSDLAAMAVVPRGLLVSAALGKQLSEPMLSDFLKGLENVCLQYKTPLVGGDITRSQGLTYFDFVVFGFDSAPILKTGARPGDLVAVSGALGSAKGGWLSLENNWGYQRLESIFLTPEAKIQTAQIAREKLHPTALTDISDSLSKSLWSLAKNSHCGFEIETEKIPVSHELRVLCQEKQLNLRDFIFNGGEDYQLLMTLPAHTSEKLISDLGLSLIGKATAAPHIHSVENGHRSEVTEVGWDPFLL